MPMLQPAQLIEHLTDAFEQGNEQLPDTRSATLAEIACALLTNRARIH